METKIKNTLFRFVALRKPEQIDDAKKLSLFVHHPHPTQSALYATTQEAFNTALEDFEASALTKDALRTLNPALYDFALWVLQNRSNITQADYVNKLDELNPTPLDTNEDVVWDNFIYQVSTHKDEQAREATMVLLYGNYLLQQITQTTNLAPDATPTTNDTPKQFRRKLQARIVRPSFMSFPAVVTTPGDPAPSQPLSLQTQKQYNTALQRLSSKHKIEDLELLKKELETANKKYNKLEAEHLKSYEEEYQEEYAEYVAELEAAIAANTSTAGIIPPVYNYTPLVQLDETRLESHLSAASFEIYEEQLKGDDIDSFEELQEKIAKQITEETSLSINTNAFSKTYSNFRGILIPNEIVNPVDENTFALEPIRKPGAGNKWMFDIAIKFKNATTEVQTINYKLTGSSLIGQSTDADFDSNEDGIVKGTLFPRLGVTIPSLIDEVLLEATIVTNTGITYTIYQPFTISLGKTIPGKLVSSGEEQQQEEEQESDTTTPNYKRYGVTRLGIADYRKVEQSVCCYVPGEVSHIENVMAREYKERATKRLRRSETTVTTEKSTETENMTDTTSTERNEMHQEISKMQQESKDFNISAGVKWGNDKGLSAHLDTSFAYHNSKEESNNLSKTEAKELTERAMERVVTKVREERINKIIDEFTEENKHGFDNRKGDKHISGVYRWVDKIYKNEIYNYGKRLMYEFMIPEPAKFHQLFANPNKEIDLVKPEDPRTAKNNAIKDFTLVTTSNYKVWAGIYNVEVQAPPVAKLVVGKSYAATTEATGGWHKEWNDLKVPDGYVLNRVDCVFDQRRMGESHMNSNVQIGNKNKVIQRKNPGFSSDFGYEAQFQNFYHDSISTLGNDTVPVSVICWDVRSFALNVNATFNRTDEWMVKWQVETFNAIIAAYEDKFAMYEEKLIALKAEAKEQRKVNPYFHREIENTILRKNCISYILGYSKIGNDFQSGGTLIDHQIKATNGSSTDLVSLKDYANVVKFIEQAFEWEIMSYIFYPFYWANKLNWKELYAADNEDVLFAKFLQSGMARVIVTVRPGFEDAVNWFLETGQVWNGNTSAPVIGDDMYLSIVEELQEPEYYVEGTWETRVPSTLTVIQNSGVGLNAEGLPCACDNKVETLVVNNEALQGQSSEEGVGYWKVNADENQTPPIYVPPTEDND